jgi:two-component system, sporulation sensor kinase E
MSKKTHPLDRVLGRLDNLDSVNLQNLVQRLARERNLLETVFNTIQEGILVITPFGVIEYGNAAAARLIGHPREQLEQALLWKLVPDLARALGVQPDFPLETTSIRSQELEIHYPETRILRFSLLPFEGSLESTPSPRLAVILTDITQERISTQEMLENEKVSSILLLAAGVAHELGNPLNSLTIHLQLLQRQLNRMKDNPATNKMAESVDICVSEVQRLDDIIKHFLEAIRPTRPDFSEVNLIELVEESLKVLELEISNRGLEVDIVLKEKLPPVMADRNQVKQAIFNVIKNAMEAMPVGGQLQISSRCNDEFAVLQFADTGSGIQQQDLNHVFTPYFTTKKEGSGLGLMIIQRIMRDHGGQVGIDSKPGVGTIVSLQFPIQNRRVRLLPNSN